MWWGTLIVNGLKLLCMINILSQFIFVSVDLGLTQGSVSEFVSLLNCNSCVLQSKNVYNFWEGVYINIHVNIYTLLASKTGFQCAKWIHNCDACTRQFFAEEFVLSFCHHLKNSFMRNGSRGYTRARNRKTRMGLVLSTTTFSHGRLSHVEAFCWLKNSN